MCAHSLERGTVRLVVDATDPSAGVTGLGSKDLSTNSRYSLAAAGLTSPPANPPTPHSHTVLPLEGLLLAGMLAWAVSGALSVLASSGLIVIVKEKAEPERVASWYIWCEIAGYDPWQNRAQSWPRRPALPRCCV